MKKLHYILVFILLLTVFFVFGQTVIIREVLYDSPLAETTSIVHKGEFLSLYNYGDDTINIGGWRVEVTSLMSSTQPVYSYTVPAGTLMPMYSLAVIASRAAADTFNIETFYGSANRGRDTVLYNDSLTFPNTRSRVRIYDADNIIQDEMIYDGTSAAIAGEQVLRAENGFNPDSLGSKAVSVQRSNITVSNNRHVFKRTDYHPHLPKRQVGMFSFTPPDYTYIKIPIQQGPGVTLPDLSLSGTETVNVEYAAPTIESTQIIASGKTTYIADEIILNTDFEVKPGAEFEAIMDGDRINNLTIMTYNLGQKLLHYTKHAQVIKSLNPDVVAVQEIRGLPNWGILQSESGLKAEMCYTIWLGWLFNFGIGLMWKPELGTPTITERKKDRTCLAEDDNKDDDIVDNSDDDPRRAYMIAEWDDFVIIATHYSLCITDQMIMTNAILNEDIVKNCINTGKPVYIAGDLNPRDSDNCASIQLFESNGFEVLNELVNDTTRWVGRPDLILEHNEKPKHKLLERGEYTHPDHPEWHDGDDDDISDHKPYYVKVRVK